MNFKEAVELFYDDVPDNFPKNWPSKNNVKKVLKIKLNIEDTDSLVELLNDVMSEYPEEKPLTVKLHEDSVTDLLDKYLNGEDVFNKLENLLPVFVPNSEGKINKELTLEAYKYFQENRFWPVSVNNVSLVPLNRLKINLIKLNPFNSKPLGVGDPWLDIEPYRVKFVIWALIYRDLRNADRYLILQEMQQEKLSPRFKAMQVDYDLAMTDRNIANHVSSLYEGKPIIFKPIKKNKENNQNIRKILERRLGILKQKQALQGANTPPDVLIEIEDIEAQL